MRNQSRTGLTLIELLIVITIVGILAVVLVPNLLVARSRGYDAAAMSCLKEIATRQEAERTQSPFDYVAGMDYSGITSCQGVTLDEVNVGSDEYHFTGIHTNGATLYQVTEGTPVTVVP